MIQQEQITQLCHLYLQTLLWNMTYYFDRCYNWSWVYPYEATPLLSDLAQVIRDNGEHELTCDVHLQETTPLQSFHQLMMILPPHTPHLLPKPYQTYTTHDQSPLIHYYPIEFELDYIGKQFDGNVIQKFPL